VRRFSRPSLAVAFTVAIALAAALASGWSWWAGREPEAAPAAPAPPAAPPLAQPSPSQARLPLRGAPLAGPTGIRLLVADTPAPYVLDVDSGRTTPITGLPTRGERVVSVAPVGNDAVVGSFRYCPECNPGPTVHYVVRSDGTLATPLARAFMAIGSRDGNGAWLLTRRPAHGCMLREVDLAGHDRRPPVLASCTMGLVADLPGGLLVDYSDPGGVNSRTELIRPDGRNLKYADWAALPLVGNLVLGGTDGLNDLTVHDMVRRTNRRLRWPARFGFSVGEVVPAPSGPLVAVEFARYSPRHVIDVWILDTRTGRWQHLPDMPTAAVPKETSLRWTGDGRLVLLNGPALGVWTPGADHIGTRRVRDSRQPGSSFLVLAP